MLRLECVVAAIIIDMCSRAEIYLKESRLSRDTP